MQLALYSSRQGGEVGDASEADAARLSPGTTFVSNPTAALTPIGLAANSELGGGYYA